ncbi:hypothetical protein KPG71_18845 [Roseovarius sp. PS-C2]|uniref:DUF6378 domain-containing protein n=1 Tax=Roseovarius sp. PS-C2 TaxID=2820814 RepID=UPI001C0D0A8E|nr:DUF6378 domain-containing protein [Roseovarius sp. PS-C2]MBU3262084.1 hypothetical protein [Roseovarius sp. PS-C2]
MLNRLEILERAAQMTTGDRDTVHGSAEKNFERVAALWSAYLDIELSAHDVAVLQALFKIARIKGNPQHGDNWIDMSGYGALGGEIAGAKP